MSDFTNIFEAQRREIRKEPDSIVYFFQEDKGNAIKIGYTRNFVQRFYTIRSAIPYDLKILATMRGGRTVEALVHLKFRSSLIRREWFLPNPDLIQFISSLPTPKPAMKNLISDAIKSNQHPKKYWNTIAKRDEEL